MVTSRGFHYYEVAHRALGGVIGHPGFEYLKNLCHNEKGLIVDAGSGEGSRLDYLVKGENGLGIEINEYALKLAKKQFPRFKYLLQKDTRIPLEDNLASIVYSTFVLEHTLDPRTFVTEMIRITKPGGYVIILCPNFGAPNRRSPNSIESPIKKLINGFISDFQTTTDISNWIKVVPKTEYKRIDDDTTVEPYLGSLVACLKSEGLQSVKSSSLWELEPRTLNPRKLLFLILGKLNIFPFKYWGPQVFVSARKK